MQKEANQQRIRFFFCGVTGVRELQEFRQQTSQSKKTIDF